MWWNPGNKAPPNGKTLFCYFFSLTIHNVPNYPGGSPPPAYAPLLLDTPVIESHQPILPPPGAQLPSSPSISDLEVQCFGDAQVLCSEISLLHNLAVALGHTLSQPLRGQDLLDFITWLFLSTNTKKKKVQDKLFGIRCNELLLFLHKCPNSMVMFWAIPLTLVWNK